MAGLAVLSRFWAQGSRLSRFWAQGSRFPLRHRRSFTTRHSSSYQCCQQTTTSWSLDHKLPQLQTLKPLALERFPDQGTLAAVCERVRAGLVKYNYTKGQAQDKVDEYMQTESIETDELDRKSVV